MSTTPTSPVFTIMTDPPRCDEAAFGPWAVYGLAGDPPHRGHLSAIRWLTERAGKVIVVLSAAHAFGKAMAPYERRHAWLNLLVQGLPTALRDRVMISDVEERLFAAHPGRKVYSIDVMLQLQAEHPGHDWVWGFGPDNANPATLQRFHRWQDLAQWPVWCVEDVSTWRSTRVRHLLDAHDHALLSEGMGEPLAHAVIEWACTKDGQAWLAARRAPQA